MPERLQYSKSVFINCPFDDQYKPIFYAIVFAVIDCGYTVRCALEAQDTSSTRIDKIYKLIKECQFGIHDVSRIEQDLISGLPRFNMPFELGLFLGALQFGDRVHKRKSCLVLSADRYSYQKFISDIAGQDIRQHGNKPKQAVGAVRDWLQSLRSAGEPLLPGATAIMTHYKEFQRALPLLLQESLITNTELAFFDRATLMGAFVKKRAENVR
jgi:hypothetical protein